MEFLLDANVLIDANRDYYAIDSVPEFWEWLSYHGDLGNVKIPIEIYEELTQGNDALANWAKRSEIKNALLLSDDVEIGLVQKVVREGYADDLDDTEVDQLGRDPFLIARGLITTAINQRCIVTTESSKPSKTRSKRKIPDVCAALGIACCNSYEFFKLLKFKTDWEARLSD